MTQQSASLMGGDAVITGQRSIPTGWITQAHKRSLNTAYTAEFPSMLLYQEKSVLVEIKSVPMQFPFSGDFLIQQREGNSHVKHGPQADHAWLSPELMQRLQLHLGDRIQIGEAEFIVDAVLIEELSRGGDLFSLAPRVMISDLSLTKTKLIQTGSRVKYQLVLSGDQQTLMQFHHAIEHEMQMFYRWENAIEGRPEIKTIIDKANQYLGLCATVSVLMSMVAMLLVIYPYMKKNLQAMALYRCIGASSLQLVGILFLEVSGLALSASLVGVIVGYALHTLFFNQLSGMLYSSSISILSSGGFIPHLLTLIGATYLFALVLFAPIIITLSKSSVIQLIRSDVRFPQYSVSLFVVFLCIIALIVVQWFSQSILLTLYFVIGLSTTFFILSLIFSLIQQLAQRLSNNRRFRSNFLFSMALSAYQRRTFMVLLQACSLCLFVVGIMVTSVVKSNLIDQWLDRLSNKTPNHFIINVQNDQLPDVKSYLSQHQLSSALYPMIRGRLVKVNGQVFQSSQFQDERARRLAEREFNLSMSDTLKSDNQVTQGKWWSNSHQISKNQISIEERLAETLNLKLGDQLTFDISGEMITLNITSLRKVNWESLSVNFFAISPEGTFSLNNASFISSLYVPPTMLSKMTSLIQKYPNLTIIDVRQILTQFESIVTKVLTMFQLMFIATLVSSCVIIMASLYATVEERMQESITLKILGAQTKQIHRLILIEYFVLIFTVLIVGAILSCVIVYLLSTYIFNTPILLMYNHELLILLCFILLIPYLLMIVLRSKLNIPVRLFL